MNGPGPERLRAELRRVLARGTSDLPSLPRGVSEALRLARTAALDFDEVAAVAAGDPPLSARVVSVANSALYARSGPRVASVRLAAVRLGVQATRDVLYQVAYASMFVMDAPRFKERIEATFEHGVRAGAHARRLASELRLDGDVCFLAGLLHDLGRARCWKVLAQLRGEIDAASAARVVEELHTVAGAELAAAWRLPEEVVGACRWHHDPGDREYPRLVAAADALARQAEGRGGAEDALALLVGAGVRLQRAGELLAECAATARH
ncbi:MAG: HDOD domain-containing protein [Myxococcales bacterium]|nr:HDOD domain-containing protein [Myxococcales bacterium]